MTQQIAEAVESAISPRGVGVLVEAQHLLPSMMRGVEKQLGTVAGRAGEFPQEQSHTR